MNTHCRTSRFIAALSLGVSAIVVLPGSAGAVVSTTPTNPLVLSIPQPKAAWSLDRVPCGSRTCVQLDTSTNQGTTWTAEHLPTSLESWLSAEASSGFAGDVQMHFSSALNGWIYGARRSATSTTSELWATTNGGHAWSQIATTVRGMRSSVLAVGTYGNAVYVVAWRDGQHFGLWRSPLMTTQWTRVDTPDLPVAAGGSMMVGSLTVVSTNGWLTIGNDRGVTGAARLRTSTEWVAMRPACATVGNSYAAPVPVSASTLLAMCTIGGFGSHVDAGTPASLVLGTQWLYRSTDGGQHFVPLRLTGRSAQNQLVGSSLAYGAHPAALFLTRSVNGATGAILQRSTTMGAWWVTVAAQSSSSLTPQFTSLVLAQNFGGVIVQTSGSHATLWLTRDAGQHWFSVLG